MYVAILYFVVVTLLFQPLAKRTYGTDLMQRRSFVHVRVQVHLSSSGTTREYQCYYSRVRVPSLSRVRVPSL